MDFIYLLSSSFVWWTCDRVNCCLLYRDTISTFINFVFFFVKIGAVSRASREGYSPLTCAHGESFRALIKGISFPGTIPSWDTRQNRVQYCRAEGGGLGEDLGIPLDVQLAEPPAGRLLTQVY